MAWLCSLLLACRELTAAGLQVGQWAFEQPPHHRAGFTQHPLDLGCGALGLLPPSPSEHSGRVGFLHCSPPTDTQAPSSIGAGLWLVSWVLGGGVSNGGKKV